MRRVVIIGGGISGLASARELARAGDQVTVLEAAPLLGGLVSGFEIGGASLERYYHYVLPQETDVQDLIKELGLADRFEWFPGSIGILTGGKVWPFTSPVDLIRFAPLSFADRIRAGVGALRLGRVRDWPELDAVPAREWLTGLTSPAVTEIVWDPLLRAKFGPAAGQVPAAWMWGRLDQRRRARRGTGEVLGYLHGGFGLLFEALGRELEKLGVEIRLGTRATRIVLDGDAVAGVEVAGEVLPADAVLFAGTLPQINDLLPADRLDPRWQTARGLGAITVILELDRPLTQVFWTNVCDRDVPFGGIIEHTNLVPPAWYGGRHVVYLSRYFTPDEPIASADLTEEVDRWLDVVDDVFGVSRDEIHGVHPFRTNYAAPLVSVPYVPRIPPIASHIGGLFLATTAQIYPQDRGMHEGIRRARHATTVMQGGRWTCPVCGGPASTPIFDAGAEGSDGGVDPAAFRPSSDEYGQLTGTVVACVLCGHRTVAESLDESAISDAYTDAVDEVSLREEPGQQATAVRALEQIEREVPTGRMLDVGCWTGSFLVAAAERGWETVGLEPSKWAASRAAERGVQVLNTELATADLGPSSFDAVVSCDVLEHLVDPGEALDRIAELLRPGGVLYLTVPDAGSRLARTLGRRWWGVVPMHVQYFSRGSMTLLLARHGFDVRHVANHPKLFSVRYYAERFGSFIPRVGRIATRVVERSGRADKLIGPDFGDRMEMLAVRKAPAE